jgi:hypothetical protein
MLTADTWARPIDDNHPGTIGKSRKDALDVLHSALEILALHAATVGYVKVTHAREVVSLFKHFADCGFIESLPYGGMYDELPEGLREFENKWAAWQTRLEASLDIEMEVSKLECALSVNSCWSNVGYTVNRPSVRSGQLSGGSGRSRVRRWVEWVRSLSSYVRGL